MNVTNETKEILHTLIKRYPILSACVKDIQKAFETFCDCFACGGKILLCGNGGSAADCGHIVGELMKGFLKRRPISQELGNIIDSGCTETFSDKLQIGLPAIDLCANSALSAAIINDLGGDLVYAQQVLGYGSSDDVLIGISTSGNANNVCKAAIVARAKGMKIVGLVGGSGGKLQELSDICICVPAKSTPEIQELHLPIYHTLCAMLEAQFFVK